MGIRDMVRSVFSQVFPRSREATSPAEETQGYPQAPAEVAVLPEEGAGTNDADAGNSGGDWGGSVGGTIPDRPPPVKKLRLHPGDPDQARPAVAKRIESVQEERRKREESLRSETVDNLKAMLGAIKGDTMDHRRERDMVQRALFSHPDFIAERDRRLAERREAKAREWAEIAEAITRDPRLKDALPGKTLLESIRIRTGVSPVNGHQEPAAAGERGRHAARLDAMDESETRQRAARLAREIEGLPEPEQVQEKVMVMRR